MGPEFEEIIFADKPPLIEDILALLHQRTGLQVDCQQNDALQGPDSYAAAYTLTNYEDEGDSLELLYERDNQLYLLWGLPTTYLIGATLHTLIAMGGSYDSKPPTWTLKKWPEVAEKVKSLPRHEHPDWIFD
jgi:hypothetical protein